MTSSATRRGPTARDLSRLVLARASSRMVVERAHESYSDTILTAFRAEIGATVRRVSPLLLALLEHGCASIDDLAWRLRPAEGWPYLPILPASGTVFHADEASLEFPIVSVERVGRPFDMPVAAWHGVEIANARDERIAVHVVDHTLEMAGRIGGMWITTLFGEVRIEIARKTLRDVPSARAGRPLEKALGLAALKGRGWVVAGATQGLEFSGVEITAAIGSRSYRLPWSR